MLFVEDEIKIFKLMKEELKRKISTDKLLVSCKLRIDTDLIEMFSQYDTLGKEFHKVTINPKRSLVLRYEYQNEEVYYDVHTLERIYPVDYSCSNYTTSYPGSILEITLPRRKQGYLMTFREYIKKKIGININEVTLNQAKFLLMLANMIRPRKFVLSKEEDEAKEQLKRKVYLEKRH